MSKPTRSATALLGTPIRLVVAFALFGLVALGLVMWGHVPSGKATLPVPNPEAQGRADSVEQAAERAARRYLAPLLNTPRVLTKVSAGRCKPAKPDHSLSVYRHCIVKVDGPTADCTMGALVRLFDSGTFYAHAKTLRCQ